MAALSPDIRWLTGDAQPAAPCLRAAGAPPATPGPAWSPSDSHMDTWFLDQAPAPARAAAPPKRPRAPTPGLEDAPPSNSQLFAQVRPPARARGPV
jgi:hypothetical protein